ncbi:hypothetical protein EV182_004336, partial [Spiromyces aspiralis]
AKPYIIMYRNDHKVAKIIDCDSRNFIGEVLIELSLNPAPKHSNIKNNATFEEILNGL